MPLTFISTYFFKLHTDTGCSAEGETCSQLGYCVATDDATRSAVF